MREVGSDANEMIERGNERNELYAEPTAIDRQTEWEREKA